MANTTKKKKEHIDEDKYPLFKVIGSSLLAMLIGGIIGYLLR